MNPERYINKKQEEANELNDKVDQFYEDHPRSQKGSDEVADEMVKGEATEYLSFRNLSDNQREWYQNMSNVGVKILEDGFLEIPRWDRSGGSSEGPKLMKQKVDGINSAIRMQDHILGGYRIDSADKESEYSKLESIQEVIEYANEILNSWNEASEEERKGLQNDLAVVVLQLERCTNEFKQEVKEQAEATMTLKDSLGRENPSALAARTVAALNNLAKRLSEMQLISPFMALRKEILTLEKRRLEGALKKADSRLGSVISHSVFRVDEEQKPEEKIRDDEVKEMDKRIGQAAHQLETAHISPYLQQAEQAKFELLANLKKSFRSKEILLENLDEVRDGIEKARSILNSDLSELG